MSIIHSEKGSDLCVTPSSFQNNIKNRSEEDVPLFHLTDVSASLIMMANELWECDSSSILECDVALI